MDKNVSAQRILVVDDDALQVRLLKELLSKNGYEVVSTQEAAVGLQTAIDDDIALIVLDVMMPIINGYNFCKLLKSQEKKKHIPVIMLTSRDKKEDEQFGKEAGADAYLTKPLNTALFLETVKRLIG